MNITVRNNIRTMFVFLTQPFIQIASVILIAKNLDINEVGNYFVLTSLSAIFIEIVCLGYSDAVIRDQVYNRTRMSDALYGLIIRLFQSLPFAMILTATMAKYSNSDFEYVYLLLFFLMDILGQRLISASEHFWIASDAPGKADAVRLIGPIVRLAFVFAAVLIVDIRNGFDVAMAGAMGTLLVGILNVWSLVQAFGFPTRSSVTPIQQTISFAVNQFARSTQQNIDRYALSLVADAGTVAVYTVATRIIMAACLPVQAVMRNSYRKYFVLGRRDVRNAILYSQKLAVLTLSISFASGLGVFIVSPILPLVFGDEYIGSTRIAQMMFLIPVLWGAYYLVGNIMSGINQQERRSAILIVSAMIQVVLLVILGAKWQEVGAGIAQYGGISSAVALTVLSLYITSKKSRTKIK